MRVSLEDFASETPTQIDITLLKLAYRTIPTRKKPRGHVNGVTRAVFK